MVTLEKTRLSLRFLPGGLVPTPTVSCVSIDISVLLGLLVALCDRAFEAEILREGIQSIAESRRESARSLGFTPWETMRLVILPPSSIWS